MRYAAIRSTGIYVPEREVPNSVFRERLRETAPEFVDKMEATSGIRTRWYAPDEWATSDLAVRAGRQALDRAGVRAEEVDLVLVGTDSPDTITPCTSVVVATKLGARRAGTFDVGCACASFPTALAAGAGLIATNRAITRVLVIGAYMMRKLADPLDPMTFFYGDGAGAALLVASGEPGVLASAYRADGAYADHWSIAAGGTREPTTESSFREGRTVVRMREKYPAEVNEEGWPDLVCRVAGDSGFGLDAIDLVLFTQVRLSTIEVVMARLGLPMSRTHVVMTKWGYTGSACIPMALEDAVRQGKVKPGQKIVLVGSGVGYNQAGVGVRVTERLVGAEG